MYMYPVRCGDGKWIADDPNFHVMASVLNSNIQCTYMYMYIHIHIHMY